MEIQKYTKGAFVSFRPQDIIEARYKLTSKQNDIMDMVFSKMKNDNQLRYEIVIQDYKEYYLEQQNIYHDFKKTVESISVKGLGLKNAEGKGYTYYPWFSKIKYVDNEGRIEVDFHPEMKQIITLFMGSKENKKIFYNLKYSIRLTNEYAKRFYYYCKSFEDTKWRKDKLEDLMLKMECPKSYFKPSNFEKNVLQIAKYQINKYTDLVIDPILKDKTYVETKIRHKTEKEMEELQTFLLNKKNTTKKRKTGTTRQMVESLSKEFIEINIEAKRSVAEELNISVKSVERYLSINANLTPQLITMLDVKFIGVEEAYKLSREEKKLQEKQYLNICKKTERLKSSLCYEMKQLLDGKKISYKVAETYSKKSEAEQLKYLNNNFKNFENEIAIEVEYKDVEVDIAKVINLLSELNINSGQAQSLLENSNGNFEKIKYIYNELKKQKKVITNPIGWMLEMVKEDKYNATTKFTPKNSFNNFTPRENREVQFKEIEKQLLGWDEEDEIIRAIERDKENETLELLSFLKVVIPSNKYSLWCENYLENIKCENEIVSIICKSETSMKVIKKYKEEIEEYAEAKYNTNNVIFVVSY